MTRPENKHHFGLVRLNQVLNNVPHRFLMKMVNMVSTKANLTLWGECLLQRNKNAYEANMIRREGLGLPKETHS